MSISKKDLQLYQLKKQQEQNELFQKLADINHKIPKTRREFLAQGLISAATTMALPTLSQLIASSAWGADADVSCQGGQTAAPAFIHLQLAGGAALFANYLQCGPNGEGVSGTTMGVGATPSSEDLFNNFAPFWKKSQLTPDTDAGADGSHIIRGMRNRFTSLQSLVGGITFEQFLGKAGFCAISHESQDDAVTNKQEISGMLKAAGIAGSTLPYLISDFIAPADELFSSPGSRFAPAILPASNFLKVETANSLIDSLGFRGTLSFGNSQAIQGRMITAINDLSKKQVEALAKTPRIHDTQRVFEGLVACSTKKNVEAVAGSFKVDIYNDYPAFPSAQNIWTGDVGTLPTAVLRKVGITVCNVMSGMSGAAVINLGGYDYHLGRDRTIANRKDREAGDILARIMATAQMMNRKVFIFVSTDGSLFAPVSSDPGVAWQNDSSKKGTSYMIGYNPTGVIPMSGYAADNNGSYQLNFFNSSGEVNTSHAVAAVDNQEVMAAAVFLNYLSFANELPRLNRTELTSVRARLTGSLPSNETSIFDYYTRFKPS